MFIEELINDEIGEMSWALPNNEKVWCKLHPLTDFDEKEYYHVQLRPEETLYRMSTDRSRFCGLAPLIKVNAKKGLIYFLQEREDDKAYFDTKGTKAKINIYN